MMVELDREVCFDVAADLTALAGMRKRVVAFVLDVGGTESVADDLALIASELATNVIVHTVATSMSVTVRLAANEWELLVCNATDRPICGDGAPLAVPSRRRPGLPGRGARGLSVVAALADSVTITDSEGTLTVRAVRTRSGSDG